MREHRQPSLRDRLRIVVLAALDGFERIEVECHSPGTIEVRAGGNQVGDVAGGLVSVAAATSHDYGLPGGGLSGEGFHRNAGDEFLSAAEQLHLAAFDQRVVVLGDETDGIAFAGMAS